MQYVGYSYIADNWNSESTNEGLGTKSVKGNQRHFFKNW